MDPKDIEIHELRNQLMSAQNAIEFLKTDILRIADRLRAIPEAGWAGRKELWLQDYGRPRLTYVEAAEKTTK